jgi:predicted nucleic acid-binding protein
VPFYLDTSALVKFVLPEPESGALRAWWAAERRTAVAGDLVRTELARAVRRVSPEAAPMAQQVLRSITLVQLTPQVCDSAGRLDPPGLRSLDALHLATALDLGDDLQGMVVYDDRLAEAARAYGMQVITPR